jgi:ParB family chromosome partitioning protein
MENGENMENKALGKGLSALIPERTKSTGEGVTYLKIDLIKDNSLQPRTNYDDEKLESLKASIKEKGVLQPILVRQKNDSYEVVAGERRLKAARSLNLGEVPVIIKDVSDQEALVIALIENIQREELNPIEEAEAYKRLIEQFHYTQEAVAKSVGKDRSTIANLLRLLNLSEDIQKEIYGGKLSVGHARALLSIESVVERKRLVDLTLKNQLSVRELENLVVASGKGGSRREKQKKVKDYEMISLEEELQKTLGTKVRILSQKKRGKIEIEYYSSSDLDRIIQLIRK